MRLFRVLTVVALIAVATTAFAQFGHPLKGTWSGDWGANKTHVVLEFNWDGKNLTGSINPGASAVTFSKVTLDGMFMVHAEGEKDGTKYVLDGKMENIGSYARVITGTWQQGNQKGNFKITRN
jgi:hypothetical protein